MKLATHITVRFALLAMLAFGMRPATANPDITLEITGLDGAVRQNVESYVLSGWTLHPRLDSKRRREAFLANARNLATQALRPWGFYAPTIESRLERPAPGEDWVLRLAVTPGPPIRVGEASVRVTGPGANEAPIEQWLTEWPLTPEQVLDQAAWEEQKARVLELAQSAGYLGAAFTARRIALDLERNRADLELHLETGPRAIMGDILYKQDVVDPAILAPIGRFQAGDAYQAEHIDALRLDLWRTGYFGEIEVSEHPRKGTHPVVVDIQARMTGRHRTTHQVSVGYGTDTQLRTQYNWTRHRLSRRGDSLSAAIAWRQRYSEILASTEYRLPRKAEKPQFWVVNGMLRRENQSFIVRPDQGQDSFLLASGEVLDAQIKPGRLRLIESPLGNDRIGETTFVALLREKDSLEPAGTGPQKGGGRGFLEELLGQTVLTVSVGMEWDWPSIRGTGFATSGFHHRARWFTANEAWGSDKNFSQVYLSSRWNGLFGERWKLLLRGEVGYSRADVRTIRIGTGDTAPTVSVTDLPYRYSFRAGGSQSVRGYRYERLSNNGIGSNHILTGSAELEYRFFGDWALAGFYDIGNAFSDWDSPELKRGWGFGLRWYSIIGSVRADFGRAEDIEGHPWEFYLTIGTPLL